MMRLTTIDVVLSSDNKSAIKVLQSNSSTCLTGISHSVIDDKYTTCISMYLICLSSGEYSLYICTIVTLFSRLIDVAVIG